MSYSEDEEDLVSTEELKHEMSAEKGLAWFDLGNGKIVKGRSFWFNAEIPETWEGREFLVHPERSESDEIGLADWVDEQILSQEENETSPKFAPRAKPAGAQTPTPSPATASPSASRAEPTKPEDPGQPASPFKLGTIPRGPGRSRGVVTTFPKSAVSETTAKGQNRTTEGESSDVRLAEKKLEIGQPPAAANAPVQPSQPIQSVPASAPKTGPLKFRKG